MQQTLRQAQKQKMMPQTLQSLQLLSMPLFALKSYLGGIVVENPFLEPRYDMMETPLSACVVNPGAVAEDEDGGSLFAPGVGYLPLREQAYSHEEESLYEHLRFQAGMCAFSAQQAAVAQYLIANINTAGYLEVALEDAAARLGCDITLAEGVLRVIQGFSPKGVGARSLSECLCLQVETQAPGRDVILRLLREDLPALAERRFELLSRKYRRSRQHVQQMLDYVQSLDPKPGSRFSGARFTPYLAPDVVISLAGTQLEVWIGGSASSMLTFDQDYMRDVSDAEASEFLRKKRLEAVNLISGLAMRNRALKLLAGYLAVEQRVFFFQGASALLPMTQRKAAADLGMSPSTISRCVQGKYMGTPWGCFPMNFFFSAGLGESTSAVQVRHEIGTLIAAEDKTAPFSDLALAQCLAGKGVQISRRTVAKYRAQLGLGGRQERIRYG